MSSDDGALWLTLNRPDLFNALTGEMVVGRSSSCAVPPRATTSGSSYSRGQGAAFSAGADLSGDEAQEQYDAGSVDGANLVVRSILELDKPVVCGLNGVAAGVGMSIALACDLVVATESAALTLAFTRIGLMPDGGGSALVAGLGRPRAGDAAGAALRPARRAGGLRRRPGQPRLRRRRTTPRAWRRSSAASPPEPRSRSPPPRTPSTPPPSPASTTPSQRERAGQSVLLRTDDVREGMEAFSEKRRPDFHGR